MPAIYVAATRFFRELFASFADIAAAFYDYATP